MSKLVKVQLQLRDIQGQVLAGFPLIRGPKAGRMAAEAYSDQQGNFEFLASENRDIEIKLLSPDNQFNEIFYCRSGTQTQAFKLTLQHRREVYRAKTRLRWLSIHTEQVIPHLQVLMIEANRRRIIRSQNGEFDLLSMLGEPVTLAYVFPDGRRISQPILYQARRINPPPLVIRVDNLIVDTQTEPNRPNSPHAVQLTTIDCAAKFAKISKIILQHEGGFVNDPQDRGGATNKGIAWRTWQAYAQQDLGVAPTLANLKVISDAQAELIYRKHYWEPKGFCQIQHDRVGLMVYDWSITSGGAGKAIQNLLRRQFAQQLTLDGIIGPQTIAALNAVADQQILLMAITKIRRDYYIALAIDRQGRRTSNYKFLKGWLNRVQHCLEVPI